MERLYMKSKDGGQLAVDGLYKDLERRIVASPWDNAQLIWHLQF